MSIKDVEIRQATGEDITHFYPNGSPRTCYAWVAYYLGKPACLAGVTVERGGCVIFSDELPCEAPKQTRWRTAKELYAHIVKLGLPFTTCIESCNQRSRRLFEKLGMTHSYDIDGKEYYVCLGWR